MNRLIAFIGVVIAILLSYGKFHDVLWAIVAGIFGWFYVIYFWIEYGYYWPQ